VFLGASVVVVVVLLLHALLLVVNGVVFGKTLMA